MWNTKKSVFLMEFPFETPVLEPESYFDEYGGLLRSAGLHEIKNNMGKQCQYKFYQNALGITNKEVDELNQVTSECNLDCPGEIHPMEYKMHENQSTFHLTYEVNLLNSDPVPEDIKLETVKSLKDDASLGCNLKYVQYLWNNIECFPDVRSDFNPFDFSTVVFCIKVYYPYLANKGLKVKIKLLQEIHVLGDQLLSEFKDKIVCAMDYTNFDEIGNSGLVTRNKTFLWKQDEESSSFIFIENKLYNDTRTNGKDLSAPLVKWSQSSAPSPFSTGTMESTKMMDLKLRIGHPYVYQHQGDCEHVLVVSDIRFLQKSDPQTRLSFPRVYATGRNRGKYCMMCGTRHARWFVMKNKRLTHDRTFFCDVCFKSYNYIDGKRVGEFRAYEYVDPVAVL